MAFRVETVGVQVMRVLAAEFRGVGVHLLDERGCAATELMGQDDGGLVRAVDHHEVQELLDRELFPFDQTGRGAVGVLEFVELFLCDGADTLQIVRFLEDDHGGRDLRQRRHRRLLFRILVENDRSLVKTLHVHDIGCEFDFRVIGRVCRQDRNESHKKRQNYREDIQFF